MRTVCTTMASAVLNPPSPLRALFLLSLVMATIVTAAGDVDAGIAIYWGQNGYEGTLRDACDSGKYAYVNIAFLHEFGQGRPPNLNLAGHCVDPEPPGSCTYLSPQIEHCQAKRIKVLLSLGGAVGPYGLDDAADAWSVAEYLWNAYLGGSSSTVRRPLGSAVLDGVDLAIDEQGATSNLYWDSLVRYLSEYSAAERKVYLSAAPQCPYPDYYLGKAIDTGLLDYVWVQFYNNHQCQYHADTKDTSDLLKSWDQWATTIKAGKLLMGLLAGNLPTVTGYMPPSMAIDPVLPAIKRYTIYGGLMLWDRYLDANTNYSGLVFPYISRTTTEDPKVLLKQVA